MGALEPINFTNIVSDNIMSPHWECQLPEDVTRDGLSHVTPPLLRILPRPRSAL